VSQLVTWSTMSGSTITSNTLSDWFNVLGSEDVYSLELGLADKVTGILMRFPSYGRGNMVAVDINGIFKRVA